MEENKEQKNDDVKQEKLSYEQLTEIANNLHQRLIKAEQNVRDISLGNTFKRLEFLFKIIENYNMFPEEFVNKVLLEIQDLMTIEESPNQEELDK